LPRNDYFSLVEDFYIDQLKDCVELERLESLKERDALKVADHLVNLIIRPSLINLIALWDQSHSRFGHRGQTESFWDQTIQGNLEVISLISLLLTNSSHEKEVRGDKRVVLQNNICFLIPSHLQKANDLPKQCIMILGFKLQNCFEFLESKLDLPMLLVGTCKGIYKSYIVMGTSQSILIRLYCSGRIVLLQLNVTFEQPKGRV
jgi:hypothetical protein